MKLKSSGSLRILIHNTGGQQAIRYQYLRYVRDSLSTVAYMRSGIFWISSPRRCGATIELVLS
jgi:hypothetical protein